MITASNLRGDEPLYRKLADSILEKIESGEFAAGSRLPSIRKFAAEVGVNNATVVSAYRFLEEKRIVFSIRGSGMYVAQKPSFSEEPPALSDFRNYINFADTSMPGDFFPAEDFRHAFDAVIDRYKAAAFAPTDENGYAPLRESVAAFLNSAIGASAEDIHIVPGMRQGLVQILSGLIRPGDSAVLESPCAPWAAAAFAFSGAKIHELPITKNGPDLDRLSFIAKKFRPKVFFLSPSFQFPTGLCYTTSNKKEILKLAHTTNAYIIEADDYANFFYDKPPTSLKAMDTSGQVIYLQSFERLLAPGFGGYAVGRFSSNEAGAVSPLVQRGLDYYLRNYDFPALCTKIRTVYAKKYRRAASAAQTFLSPYADFILPGGGLGLWISAKGKGFADEILAHKVIVSPGRIYAPGKTSHEQHFRISFSNVTEDEISHGIGIIASVLSKGW